MKLPARSRIAAPRLPTCIFNDPVPSLRPTNLSTIMLTADEVVAQLELSPLPWEGGFFRETYRSSLKVAPPPGRGPPADRNCCTHIYFLLRTGVVSAMHLVASDEVFHHYMGDAIEQLWLLEDGSSRVVKIGSNLVAGERPQVIVPAGVWQGARVAAGGTHGYALLGCSVSPGFDWADFSLGERDRLIQGWPAAAAMIEALTPPNDQHPPLHSAGGTHR